MTSEQTQFLNTYLDSLSESEREAIPQLIAEHFCNDEYNANICAELILLGQKQATCSLKAGFDIDNEALPQVGGLTVVLNWAQQPICIVKLVDVTLCAFDNVSPDFAFAEGEGDRSYEWWREAHERFFQAHAQDLGIDFTGQSELVLERFVKVFPL
ncbi:ASCH domain-containing protein [Alginatibacterium sediminis]|uniref:ASCH domain-containing protein n=1 Tax=Alginatibacterium sediminis TaxID=2164068 RepID=A0A420EHE7_9ALTE|nr:ASCH domain-containing protein [Alginatibacterium sediminis]RKF20084.1 ASCH domain-containing protein [Alginatibacterium sediminis]